jgi:hypothetical protein
MKEEANGQQTHEIRGLTAGLLVSHQRAPGRVSLLE